MMQFHKPFTQIQNWESVQLLNKPWYPILWSLETIKVLAFVIALKFYSTSCEMFIQVTTSFLK